MILYLDSSDLVKLFLEEPGSDGAYRMVSLANRVVSSIVAYAETRSALVRAWRGGRLTREEYPLVLQTFEIEWTTYDIQDLTHSLVRFAGDLAEKHLLRGFDAIHLASALTLQQELIEPVTFSAADDRLMAAARAEGLVIASAR